jgi:hypothetical protein
MDDHRVSIDTVGRWFERSSGSLPAWFSSPLQPQQERRLGHAHGEDGACELGKAYP